MRADCVDMAVLDMRCGCGNRTSLVPIRWPPRKQDEDDAEQCSTLSTPLVYVLPLTPDVSRKRAKKKPAVRIVCWKLAHFCKIVQTKKITAKSVSEWVSEWANNVVMSQCWFYVHLKCSYGACVFMKKSPDIVNTFLCVSSARRRLQLASRRRRRVSCFFFFFLYSLKTSPFRFKLEHSLWSEIIGVWVSTANKQQHP